MSPKYKDILIKKFENFELEENPEKKKLLRFEVFNILAELEKPDSNDLHIWGLTYYFSDDDKEYHLTLGLEKFLEAYELDSQNFMACLYAAHSYHDRGDLNNALKYYQLVNKEELKEFQIWRYVKLIEQIGCCLYKLGNQELGRKHFQEVLEWYKKLPFDDRAVPTELMECLNESDKIVIEIKKIEDYLN